jgi:hypothetical protein
MLKKLRLLIAVYDYFINFLRVCAATMLQMSMFEQSGYKKQKPSVLPEGF